jgi:copper chaperone CopZ
MSEHTYKFNVSMSCGGCSGAVNRVLGKLDGMSSLLFLHILSTSWGQALKTPLSPYYFEPTSSVASPQKASAVSSNSSHSFLNLFLFPDQADKD